MMFRNVSESRFFSMDEVLQELYKTVEEDSEKTYNLIVGSDSQKCGEKLVYVSVIVLHKVGESGRFFYTKLIEPYKDTDLSEKIRMETWYTIEILKKIENSILVSKIGKENLSAHVDAGETGDSRKIVDSCTGWIRGEGFRCYQKPESWAASHVADRFTK